jgi:hypothetical protein
VACSALTFTQSDIDDYEHGDRDGSGPNKPGRKKNPKYALNLCDTVHSKFIPDDFSSAAARRDQNRIAQREFRLRKQQRVST